MKKSDTNELEKKKAEEKISKLNEERRKLEQAGEHERFKLRYAINQIDNRIMEIEENVKNSKKTTENISSKKVKNESEMYLTNYEKRLAKYKTNMAYSFGNLVFFV